MTRRLLARYRRAWRTRVMDPGDPVSLRLRRRAVVIGTLLVGAGVNAWALRIPAGDPKFYFATGVLAAVWFGGAFGSGPIRIGHEPYRRGVRPVASSLLFSAVLVGVFCTGAVLVAPVDALREPVLELLAHAQAENLLAIALLTAINGVAEECFHRGAVYSAVHRWRPVLTTTAVYAAVVATAGIPLLVVAALALGLVTGLQRRSTGGVLGPIFTHVTWSMAMLFALGPILRHFA